MCRLLAVTLIAIVLLAAGCFPPAVAPPPMATDAPAAGLPNPASVFCQERGFRLEIRTDAAGNQSGVCRFPDGSECDEWAYYRGECGPAVPAAPAAAATQIATPATTAATYTSEALGISFRYLPRQNPEIGPDIAVTEQGDRIYVHFADTAPSAGQWVQVFAREAGESLVNAVARLILTGHPAENCQVKAVTRPSGAGGEAAGLEYAAIVVPSRPGESLEEMLPRWRTCPQEYAAVGGIGYFQADPRHTDRFLYVSIGQYIILAGPDLPWQETIRFE